MLISLINGLIADLNSYLLILGFLTRSTSNHATIFLLIQSNSQTSRQTLSTTSSQFSLTRIIHRNIHRSNFLTNLTSNIRNLTYRRRNRAAILVYLRALRSTSTLILRISNPIIICIRLFDGNRRQNHPLEGVFPFSICQLDRNQVATWGHVASRRTQSNSAIRVNLRPRLSTNCHLGLIHSLKQGGRNITGSSSGISRISRRLSAILLVNRCRYRGCLIQIYSRCFIFRRNLGSETIFRHRPVTGFLRVDRRRINLIFVKIGRNRERTRFYNPEVRCLCCTSLYLFTITISPNNVIGIIWNETGSLGRSGIAWFCRICGLVIGLNMEITPLQPESEVHVFNV